MITGEPVKTVTGAGVCFEAVLVEQREAPPNDIVYCLRLTDKGGSGRERLWMVKHSGPTEWTARNYDLRLPTVLLNAVRRAFDRGDLNFDAPDDPAALHEIEMGPADFSPQAPRSDSEIRLYIIHKAYWLGYKYPSSPPATGTFYPIPFGEEADLDYLGIGPPDVQRVVARLGSEGLLEKIRDCHARPTSKLLNEYDATVRPGLSSSPAEDDRKFARMAIDEARKSVPEDDKRAHPLVGAVVVRDGVVLASAHRGEIAGNHAEFVALEKKLRDSAVAGATVHTTLEPCTTRNHPKIPCAQRLAERRVARVVIGMLDPNPRISGRGQRALRRAGIATDFFPADLMSLVEDLNRDFSRAYEGQGSGG